MYEAVGGPSGTSVRIMGYPEVVGYLLKPSPTVNLWRRALRPPAGLKDAAAGDRIVRKPVINSGRFVSRRLSQSRRLGWGSRPGSIF